jgi:hypothetical protein
VVQFQPPHSLWTAHGTPLIRFFAESLVAFMV